jgi:hypothetical protein
VWVVVAPEALASESEMGRLEVVVVLILRLDMGCRRVDKLIRDQASGECKRAFLPHFTLASLGKSPNLTQIDIGTLYQ